MQHLYALNKHKHPTKMSTTIFIAIITWISLMGSSEANELYDPEDGICCDTKVTPLHKNNVHRGMLCCGQELFDWRTAICCDGKVIKIPREEINPQDLPIIPYLYSPFIQPYFGPPFSCCGGKAYNHEKQICCEDEVQKIPPQTPGTLFPTLHSCCGKQLFNVQTQDCCRKTIMNKTNDNEFCCGDKLINYEEEICCMKNYSDPDEAAKTYPRDKPDVGCCGTEKLHYETQFCCDFKIVKIPEDPQERMYSLCCGEKLFRFDGPQMCCDNKLLQRKNNLERCCGSEVYSVHKQLCCNGQLYPITGNATHCCGKNAFHHREASCCHKTSEVLPLDDKNLNKFVCCD